MLGNRTDWATASTGVTGAHVCARRTGGRLWCWGSDAWGQAGVGLPFRGNFTELTAVAGDRRWTMVRAGSRHTCARRVDARLFCWGSDGRGRLGNGSVLANRSVPSEVAA